MKLAKCLALLGSNHDGEALAAARAAHRIVAESGLSWAEIIEQRATATKPTAPTSWRQTVRQCWAQPGNLRPWEAKFLHNLRGFSSLSIKQWACLRGIAERILWQPA